MRKKDKELGGNYGFLSSKVLWKDGNICEMNIQKVTKWNRLSEFDTGKMIQYAFFVSLFIRSSMVRIVGLPYKEFFIWADDWEFTRRLSKSEPCYFIPSSVVKHWCDSNVGANIIAAPFNRIERFNYMYRNDVVLYRLDGWEGKLYLCLSNIVHRVRILFKSDNKKQKLEIIRKGTAEGKKFFPKIVFQSEE